MPLFFMFTAYLATVLSLVTGAFLGLAGLTSPIEQPSKDNRPTLVKNADPAKHIFVTPKGLSQAFRYGPDVNHGRADTPTNASTQALKEARAAVPVKKRKQPYKEHLIQDPGVAMGFAPLRSETVH